MLGSAYEGSHITMPHFTTSRAKQHCTGICGGGSANVHAGSEMDKGIITKLYKVAASNVGAAVHTGSEMDEEGRASVYKVIASRYWNGYMWVYAEIMVIDTNGKISKRTNKQSRKQKTSTQASNHRNTQDNTI